MFSPPAFEKFLFEGGEVVHVKEAVQVVQFMLYGPGSEP